MDLLSLLRTFGALGVVLGMMTGGLWLVRRFNLRLPGTTGGGHRIELVERTAIDARRSAVLLRRDGREHLLLVGPEGTTIVESGIVRDAVDDQAERVREARAAEQREQAETALREAQARMEELRSTALRNVARARRRVRAAVRRSSLPALVGNAIGQVGMGLPEAASFAAELARADAGEPRRVTRPRARKAA